MIRRLVNKMRQKILDQRGDSMVEALAAILIAALGATMLATMVMASVNVATRSERVLSDSYEAETKLVSSGQSLTEVEVAIPGDAEVPSATAKTAVTLYSADSYEYYREGKRL